MTLQGEACLHFYYITYHSFTIYVYLIIMFTNTSFHIELIGE